MTLSTLRDEKIVNFAQKPTISQLSLSTPPPTVKQNKFKELDAW